MTKTSTVQILAPNTISIDRTLIENNSKYTGYKLDYTVPASVPDTVDNGTTIKVYYVKDSFGYTIEYYYDGTKDNTKTVTETAEYQSQIITYEDKNITGYRLDHTEGLPLTISATPTDNVIKVFYVVDDGNTKTLSYTVEYYKDNAIVERDTEDRKSVV